VGIKFFGAFIFSTIVLNLNYCVDIIDQNNLKLSYGSISFYIKTYEVLLNGKRISSVEQISPGVYVIKTE